MLRRTENLRFRVLVGLVAVLAIGGCGCRKQGSAADENRPKPPEVKIDRDNPEQTVFEQLRSGAFQIAGVEGTIEEALTKVRALGELGDTELKNALKELSDTLDSVGATLAEHSDEPEEPAKTPAAFGKMDEQRLAAIAGANDALHELEDAAGILSTLSEDPALSDRAEVGELGELLQLGIDDLTEAIKSLGGQVEKAAES